MSQSGTVVSDWSASYAYYIITSARPSLTFMEGERGSSLINYNHPQHNSLSMHIKMHYTPSTIEY